MRKTKLIPLPNQNEALVATISEASSSSRSRQEAEEGSSFAIPTTTVSPITRSHHEEVASPPTMDDFLSFNRITFNPSVPRRPANPIHEERLRSSDPVSSQVIRNVPIIRTDVEFAYHDEQQQQHSPTAPSFVPLTPPPTTTIPRQLGRRSEQSPRIIAINAESNTIVIGHSGDSSSRPTSAPARVGLVTSEDNRRSVRDNNNGRGGEFDSMSSVASSRNPSPVSLASSSGSSMTSVARNGHQER